MKTHPILSLVGLVFFSAFMSSCVIQSHPRPQDDMYGQYENTPPSNPNHSESSTKYGKQRPKYNDYQGQESQSQYEDDNFYNDYYEDKENLNLRNYSRDNSQIGYRNGYQDGYYDANKNINGRSWNYFPTYGNPYTPFGSYNSWQSPYGGGFGGFGGWSSGISVSIGWGNNWGNSWYSPYSAWNSWNSWGNPWNSWGYYGVSNFGGWNSWGGV